MFEAKIMMNHYSIFQSEKRRQTYMARSHDIRPWTATDMHDPQLQAKMFVLERANSYRTADDAIELEDVYIVSFAYILSNWKALVSTTVPDDRYYEVTHRSSGETYVDVYIKEANEEHSADHPFHNL